MFVTTVEALRSTYAYFSTTVSQPCRKLMNGSGKIWQSLLTVKSRLLRLSQAAILLAHRSPRIFKHNLFSGKSLAGEFSINSSPLLALPPEVLLHIFSYLRINDQISFLSSCTTTLYELYTQKEKEALLIAQEKALLGQVQTILSSESKFEVEEIHLLGEHFAYQAVILCNANVSARERYMASGQLLLSTQVFKNEKAFVVQAHLERAFFRKLSAAQILHFLRQLAKYHLLLSSCLLIVVKKLSY